MGLSFEERQRLRLAVSDKYRELKVRPYSRSGNCKRCGINLADETPGCSTCRQRRYRRTMKS